MGKNIVIKEARLNTLILFVILFGVCILISLVSYAFGRLSLSMVLGQFIANLIAFPILYSVLNAGSIEADEGFIKYSNKWGNGFIIIQREDILALEIESKLFNIQKSIIVTLKSGETKKIGATLFNVTEVQRFVDNLNS